MTGNVITLGFLAAPGFVVTAGFLGAYTPPPPTVPAGVWTEPLRAILWTEPPRSIVWTEPVRGIVWTGPPMLILVKRLDENNSVYAYDFVNDVVMSGGDPIASVTAVTAIVVGPAGAAALPLSGATFSGTKVSVTVGAGQDDALYQLRFVVVTVAGVVRVGLGQLRVEDDQ